MRKCKGLLGKINSMGVGKNGSKLQVSWGNGILTGVLLHLAWFDLPYSFEIPNRNQWPAHTFEFFLMWKFKRLPERNYRVGGRRAEWHLWTRVMCVCWFSYIFQWLLISLIMVFFWVTFLEWGSTVLRCANTSWKVGSRQYCWGITVPHIGLWPM